MKLGDWLAEAKNQLDSAGIGTARLDTLVIAEDVTAKDRAYLLAHPEEELASSQVSKLASKLKRRVNHEPLAYIRGKTEFYGREFFIDDRVLEPRPESETMIDLLRHLDRSREISRQARDDISIIDVGTGSGALAITTKLEIPKSEVIALDIDPGCLEVAKQNANIHKVELDIYQGDLLKPLATRKLGNSPTVFLCNLPYVPNDFTINPAAMREPKIAIFGGPDGLDLYRQLFKQIDELNMDIKYILTESMPPQHVKLANIAKKHDYKLKITDDFIQLFIKN